MRYEFWYMASKMHYSNVVLKLWRHKEDNGSTINK